MYLAGHVQELCISSDMLGLEWVKWKLMSLLQMELSTQLVIAVTIDMCLDELQIIIYLHYRTFLMMQ